MPGGTQVLGFGSISVDNIIYVDQPLKNGKGRITGRMAEHGGNVATALVAVARLGGRAAFIGWLGVEPQQALSAQDLEKHGVDTSFAPRHPNARAIEAVITVGSDGERFIAYDDDVMHGTSDAISDEILSQARVLMIDGYATHALEVVSRARRLGASVVADIEWTIGSATDALMQLVDHLVLPIAFARMHTGESEVSAILRRLWSAERRAVVLTDGEKGSYVLQKGDPIIWHIPAYKATAVDTTGAGDCFHGAYAFALTQGKLPVAAALFANAAAAISVTGQGGRKALPDGSACALKMQREVSVLPVPIAQSG